MLSLDACGYDVRVTRARSKTSVKTRTDAVFHNRSKITDNTVSISCMHKSIGKTATKCDSTGILWCAVAD
jgi:hypothetical protein